MNQVDRMTVDLLNNYAFILHENLEDITDKEINKARNFANEYLKNNSKWKHYNYHLQLFINRQKFEAMTNNDYDLLRINLCETICQLNNLFNIYDWNFDIFYNIDYSDYLLLSKSQDGYIELMYNIRNNSFSKCHIQLSNDMYKLGNINYYDFKIEQLDSVKI